MIYFHPNYNSADTLGVPDDVIRPIGSTDKLEVPEDIVTRPIGSTDKLEVPEDIVTRPIGSADLIGSTDKLEVPEDIVTRPIGSADLIGSTSFPEKVIIIYGGSFSPITVGHQQVIVDIMQIIPHAKFFLVPVNDLYPKITLIRGIDKNKNYYRLAMCQMVVNAILLEHMEHMEHMEHNKWDLNVSDWTFSQNNPFIDKEIMDYYQEIYPDYHLIYLCGADTYENINRWEEKDRDAVMSDSYSMIVHPRNNDFSSTRIRKVFAETGEIIDTIPEVKDYLIENQLMKNH